MLSRLRARLAPEDGSILVIAAASMGVLLLLGAMALDTGNWFAHKRGLQNRADAGALAAGVQYMQTWRDCLNNDPTAAQAIADKARQYAGDPTYTGGPLQNTDVGNQSSMLVNINKTGFDTNSSSDGGGPCYDHPAGSDPISPEGGVWTDVKVKESKSPLLFGGTFGIGPQDITAQARVELHPILSESKFSPLALPVQKIYAAQLRLYSICGNNQPALLGTYDLQPLGAANQVVGDATLWGTPDSNGNNQQVSVPVPTASVTGCNYIRIGTELRVVGRQGLDVNNVPCPTTNTQYESCWTDVGGRWGPEVRVWRNTTPTTDPVFGDVHVSGGTCGSYPYFTRSASCTAGISVNVTWPAACTDTNLNHFSVKVNGVALTPPATPSGLWTSTANAFTLGASDATDFTVKWSASGANCASNGTNTATLHSAYVATDANSGIVELVDLTNTSAVTGTVSPFDSVPATGSIAQVYLTVGLQTAYSVGPLLTLRLAQAQGNGSINCDNGNQGVQPTYDEFVNGCTPWYGVNNFSTGFWWNGTACPSPQSFPANSESAPWLCAPGAPGLSPTQIADGIAMRTGNCTYDPATFNGGCTSQGGCANDNNYPANPPPNYHPDNTDPRLIGIFLVPYGSFYGQSGGSYSVPILDLGEFYVTGWSGKTSSKDADPCQPPAGSDDPMPQDGSGTIEGHFVDVVQLGDPNPKAQCTADQLRPCIATLVR